MSSVTNTDAGSIVALWRYPVKSMMGEDLNAVELNNRGLVGDRVYALIDSADGKVASAKNPRKWPGLFNFRAAITECCPGCDPTPPVRITLPDGTITASNQAESNRVLSEALGRDVTLQSTPPDAAQLEEYWPDVEDLDHRDEVTDEDIPAGTFFDGAAVHLLTTATINALRRAYPEGRFEVRRFRPNIVIEPDAEGFVENDWIGHTVSLGDRVRLRIDGPCPRCVMTTLPQGDLPQDAGILRTAVKENKAAVGVYATVVQGGTVRRGDSVRVE